MNRCQQRDEDKEEDLGYKKSKLEVFCIKMVLFIFRNWNIAVVEIQ